jgi:DNA-binding transcriptional LysR family regulator
MGVPRYYKASRYEHFRTFCQVARLGSFAAAGKAVGLSRPTVWQQTDTLEREFDVKLFVRAGRGVELTAEGRLLLELAQPSVAAFDSLRSAFRARLQEEGGTLRLVIIQGKDLDKAIIQFRKNHPRVHLTLVEHRSIDVIRMMENGEGDLGLAMANPEMADNPAVHFEPIGKRTISLATPADHPLTTKRSLRLEELVGYPLITFSADNPFRRNIDRVFDQAGLSSRMQVAIEVDTVETADHCVQLGLGVALVPQPRGNSPPTGVRYRSMAEHFGHIPLYLLWEKGAHLLPHVASFVASAKKLANQGARSSPAQG